MCGESCVVSAERDRKNGGKKDLGWKQGIVEARQGGRAARGKKGGGG